MNVVVCGGVMSLVRFGSGLWPIIGSNSLKRRRAVATVVLSP